MKRWRIFLVGVSFFIFSALIHSNLCLALNKEFMYDTASERDPFVSLIGGAAALADVKDVHIDRLALEGIIFDPGQGSFAIINGEVYRVSDFISGFEVKEIAENHIQLAKDGNIHTLKLPSDEDNQTGKDSHESA